METNTEQVEKSIEKSEKEIINNYNETEHIFKIYSHKYSMEDLDPLLLHAIKIKASDVFIRTNDYIRCDLHGLKYKLSTKKMDSEEIQQFVEKIYTDASGISELNKGRAINMVYVIKDVNIIHRFRVNIISVSTGISYGFEITMRHIPSIPPSLDKKEIPQEVIDSFNLTNGLVLVVGATGSGKSTLIASIIRDKLENPSISKRILSYEAPIEFEFTGVPQKKSFIVQTEVPGMIPSFKTGVEESLRRKPDDIFIGEMRDTETITNGVLVSQYGHLVYSTMHVNGVSETIKRVANIFNADERTSAVYDMITSLRMILSQRLRPSLDGKRIAIREYLCISDEIRQKLIKEDINLISNYLEDALWEFGVPFLVHAKQRLLEGIISNEVYEQFKAGRSETERELDDRIRKLKKAGNVMFQNNNL